MSKQHNHRKYVPGCPVCEQNAKYIKSITNPDITVAERAEADSKYRKGEL